MARPTCLFVYRTAPEPNGFFARCVVCSPERSEFWERCEWRGYGLPDGPSVEVRQSISDEAPFTSDPRIASVYASEPFDRDADVYDRPRLWALQNYAYVHIAGVRQLPSVPFFVSFETPGTPVVARATIQLLVADIAEIPDVGFYIAHHEVGESLDHWDKMMATPPLRPIPIPSGCLLPATFRQGSTEVLGVYRIRNREGNNAECEVFLSDHSLDLRRSISVLRRGTDRRGQTRECLLGIIPGVDGA
jgi:hypothetical protein